MPRPNLKWVLLAEETSAWFWKHFSAFANFCTVFLVLWLCEGLKWHLNKEAGHQRLHPADECTVFHGIILCIPPSTGCLGLRRLSARITGQQRQNHKPNGRGHWTKCATACHGGINVVQKCVILGRMRSGRVKRIINRCQSSCCQHKTKGSSETGVTTALPMK